MDAIAQATQNNLNGRGYLNGDGTGFGKAREATGMALDWTLSGHAKRVLIATARQPNVTDLINEFGQMGPEVPPLVRLTDYKIGGKGSREAEIPVHDTGIYLIDAANFNKYRGVLERLQFDGFIADEADEFKNLLSGKGGAWTEFHKSMLRRKEKPFFAYLTATAGEGVDELGYLHGLRLWPMDRFSDWLGLITGERTKEEVEAAPKKKGLTNEEIVRLAEAAEAGDVESENILQEEGLYFRPGMSSEQVLKQLQRQGRWGRKKEVWESILSPAATEQVMRELAQDGAYMARDLWRGGVEFEVVPPVHEGKTVRDLVPAPRIAEFNKRVALMRKIERVFQIYGAENKASTGMRTIRGSLQFHYKRALFDLNLDNVIDLAEKGLKRGQQVVISLLNVRATKDEEGEGNLAGAIKEVNTEKVDKAEDGTPISQGRIPEAVRAKALLMEELRGLPPLRDPLKEIENRLGKKNIVMVTGLEDPKQKAANIKRFEDGQVPVVVISAAGQRGINLHHRKWADHLGPERGRRLFIAADLQWRASPLMQAFGRVDRAGQITAPQIQVPHLALAPQKKFLGTAAIRLANLGATSKGMEGSTGTEALDDFVIGGRLDAAAWRLAYQDMPEDMQALFTKGVFKDPVLPHQSRDPEARRPASQTTASFNDFMLDLQLMPIEDADRVYAKFLEAREKLVNDPKHKVLGAARAARAHGHILQSADLGEGLVLYQVKTDAPVLKEAEGPRTFNDFLKSRGIPVSLAGVDRAEIRALEAEYTATVKAIRGESQRYGIVAGRMATNGKVSDLVRSMFSENEAAMEGGYHRFARFVSLQDVDTGQWISGLEVPFGKIDLVAEKFGAKLQARQTTDDTLLEDLRLGLKVRVRGPGGDLWVLRQRRDGRVAIDGARMRHESALLPEGLPRRAAFDAPSASWWLPEELVPEFLKAFPIIGTEAKAGRRVRQRPEIAAQPAAEGVPEPEPIPSRPVPPAVPADSTDLQAIGARIRHLEETIPRVIDVGQSDAIPEIDAEIKALKDQQERVLAGIRTESFEAGRSLGERIARVVSPRILKKQIAQAEKDVKAAYQKADFRYDLGSAQGVDDAMADAQKAEARLTALRQQAAPKEPGLVISYGGTEIASRPTPPPIAAQKEVSPAEKIVLAFTRSLYNARGRERDIRFREAHRYTGVTASQWGQALVSLVERGWLTRAGGLTEMGKERARPLKSHDKFSKADLEAPSPPLSVLSLGKQDYLMTPHGRVDFRYELVRAADLIPSHDPMSFRPVPGYPEGVQNRPYHSDKSEQAKVVRQVLNFEPRFVLSTAPDAINGPPIVAPDSNLVIGGNSRAMTILRTIRGRMPVEGGEDLYGRYFEALRADAAKFGIDPGALTADGFPILVRRVINTDGDPDTLRALARSFNEPLTQALNTEAEAISRGRAVSPETFSVLADALTRDDASLADILRRPDTVRALVPFLIRDGLFSRSDINRYATSTGELNEQGRRAVEQALLGSVVQDADLLATAPPAMTAKIGKSLGALAELRDRPAWDLTETFRRALLTAKRARDADMDLKDFLAQQSLFGQDGTDPKAAVVALRLIEDRPLRFAQRAALYARESRGDLPTQMTLGLTERPTPDNSFEAHFGGPDAIGLPSRPLERRAEAGFIDPALLTSWAPGKFENIQRAVQALNDWWDATAKSAAQPGFRSVTSPLPPEPIATGRYAKFVRELGPEVGRQAFTVLRRAQNARALVLRHIREDTKRWFRGLTKLDRAMLFEAAKGVRINPETGGLAFGGLQPAGVLDIKGRKERRAVNARLGVDMRLEDALAGGRLANGLLLGEPIFDRHAIQLYRIITPDAGRAAYEQTIQQVPRAAEILADYIRVGYETGVEPMYGVRFPPRSRETAALVFDVRARRADEIPHVPSVLAEGRTFVGRIRRALSGFRSPHRRLKTGELAESGRELKDLMAATRQERISLLEEDIRNRTSAALLSLVLEPYRDDFDPATHTEFHRGVLKDPKGFIAWASRNHGWLEDKGIDVRNLIQGGALAGGKRYIINRRMLEELQPLLGPKTESADPKYRALARAADETSRAVTNYILATYLVRPATAVRNHVTEAMRNGTRTLRDFIDDLLKLLPASDYQGVPMAQTVANVIAPLSALTREVREAFPAEALGKTFARDLGHTNLPGLILRYNTFESGEVYAKRIVYEAVTRAAAANYYKAARERGLTDMKWPDFLKDFRRRLIQVAPEVEQYAYRTMDTVGAGDYWNIPRGIEALKKTQLGRGVLPYPTYYQKLLAGTYRTYSFDPFLGARNYAELFGAGRSVAQRRRALANMLTGVIVTGIFWNLIPDAWDDYPDGMKDEDVPPEYRTAGRVRIWRDKDDYGYWLRVLDLPFIGDIIAAKAMMKRHYTVREYLNDRLSVGPVATIAAALMGRVSMYEASLPMASIVGRQVAGWMPMSPVWQYIRRVHDPYKRRIYRNGAPWYENFYRGFAENFPGLSEGGQEIPGTGLEVPRLEIAREQKAPHLPMRYPPTAEHLKFSVLNIRTMREGARRAAIAEAYRQKQEQEMKRLIRPGAY